MSQSGKEHKKLSLQGRTKPRAGAYMLAVDSTRAEHGEQNQHKRCGLKYDPPRHPFGTCSMANLTAMDHSRDSGRK